MNWHALWKHMDGLIHVVGIHHSLGAQRIVFAECYIELCGLVGPNASNQFAGANTTATFPTCIACWYHSNFGTYRSRHVVSNHR